MLSIDAYVKKYFWEIEKYQHNDVTDAIDTRVTTLEYILNLVENKREIIGLVFVAGLTYGLTNCALTRVQGRSKCSHFIFKFKFIGILLKLVNRSEYNFT